MTVQSSTATLSCDSPQLDQPLRYPLSSDRSITLGRASSCQITLDAPHFGGISRQHAELTTTSCRDGEITWQIRDLNSTNGTFINGQRLETELTLKSGDRIRFGQNDYEFIFESQHQVLTVKSNDSEVLPATVYDHSSHQHLSTSLPLHKKGAIRWKVFFGIVGAIVVFNILNSSPPQPQPQRSTAPTVQSPSPSSQQPFQTPATSDLVGVEFQNTALITSFFNVGEAVIHHDEVIKTSTGQEVELDLYTFEVRAKSTFDNSDVNLFARFYNANGDEIGELSPVVYFDNPSPNQWRTGDRGVAVFALISDRTNLKVIRFFRKMPP